MSRSAVDVRVEPATLAHAADLAPRMRKADVEEVWASGACRPQEALERSLRMTPEPWSGFANGELVCMFGIAPLTLLGDVGLPWLLGSHNLPQYARRFLRLNRHYMACVKQDYRLLVNYVDARNSVAIRWLGWLGFTILPAEPYGPFGLPFHRFEMRV